MTGDLLNKKILVVGSIDYGYAVSGLGTIVGEVKDFFEKPEEFSLVLFTGGADVSPELYGDTSPKGYCVDHPARDAFEKEVFNHARKHDIRMTGICRGSQFINVMSGGRMMHHITNHGVEHTFSSHRTEEIIKVSSTHHQMCLPGEGGYVVGWSTQRRSRTYIGTADMEEAYNDQEVEAILYPKTLCFGVQYHPEFLRRTSGGYQWYWQAIKEFITLPIDEFTKLYTGTENARIAVGSNA